MRVGRWVKMVARVCLSERVHGGDAMWGTEGVVWVGVPVVFFCLMFAKCPTC